MVSSVQGTTNQTAAAGTAVPAKLHTAAVQFESLMLKELIAPLTKTSDDEDGEGAQSNPLQGFAADAVASSMAQSGALGFAREIEQTLQQKATKVSSNPLKS